MMTRITFFFFFIVSIFSLLSHGGSRIANIFIPVYTQKNIINSAGSQSLVANLQPTISVQPSGICSRKIVNDTIICLDLIDKAGNKIPVKYHHGYEPDEVIIDTKGGFPSDNIRLTNKVPAGEGDGYLLIKVTREYKIKVEGEKIDKIELFHSDGFYKSKRSTWSIWLLRKFLPQPEKVPKFYDLRKYNNYTMNGNHSSAGKVYRDFFNNLYWHKNNSGNVVLNHRDHELRYNNNPNRQIFSCLLIHFKYRHKPYDIEAKLSNIEENNNLEKIFIDTITYGHQGRKIKNYVFFNEQNNAVASEKENGNL